jgi:hypothetical protein
MPDDFIRDKFDILHKQWRLRAQQISSCQTSQRNGSWEDTDALQRHLNNLNDTQDRTVRQMEDLWPVSVLAMLSPRRKLTRRG